MSHLFCRMVAFSLRLSMFLMRDLMFKEKIRGEPLQCDGNCFKVIYSQWVNTSEAAFNDICSTSAVSRMPI